MTMASFSNFTKNLSSVQTTHCPFLEKNTAPIKLTVITNFNNC
jgi:hypothetical protein